MTQLGLAGMPRRLLSCTPTRLATYEDCPRRYRMTYLDRPAPTKGLPWAHNSLGVSVHNALRLWWQLPAARRTPAAAGALLETAWLTAGYRDDAQSGEWRAAARGWVEGYVATLDPAGDPAGLERTVSVPTARLALSGRVDRIDDRDGELVVVDYKTGRQPPTLDDVRGSRSLALYALAVARTLRRVCRQVELHHLPTGSVVAWEHDAATLARHLRRAEDTAADVVTATEALAAGGPAEELFPPLCGPRCGLCDFRGHCPEGRAAAPARHTWSGLAPSASDSPVR